MRKSMPLRWIEQQEETQIILDAALFHPAPKAVRQQRSAVKDLLRLLSLGCMRLAELTLPPVMVQPVPVRVRRDDRRSLPRPSSTDDHYSC